MAKRNGPAKRQEYANIFNDLGSDWEAIVEKRDTSKEVNFVEHTLPKNGIILDLCCGTGRHSILLRKRGKLVVGMDLSPNLLGIAKQRMKELGASFPLVRADMRHFPFKSCSFDAIICMFTSFGYLPSELDDALSLFEVRRTLNRNGKLLLDLSNRDHMIRNFRERDWAEFEPYYLLENRMLDIKNSKLRSEWTLIRKDSGQVDSILHEVRLYTLPRITRLLNEAKLTIKRVYGGYEQQEFNRDASRMITLAEAS